MSADIHCEISINGGMWLSLILAQQQHYNTPYKELGLPTSLCEYTSITHEIHNDVSKIEPNPAERPFGKTWLTMAELPLLFEAKHWLSERYLEHVPPHAYTEYAEIETIQAWLAFAEAYEKNGFSVRLVVWFLL